MRLSVRPAGRERRTLRAHIAEADGTTPARFVLDRTDVSRRRCRGPHVRASIGALIAALVVVVPAARAQDVTALLRAMHEALVPDATLRADFTLEVDDTEGGMIRWNGTLERKGGREPTIRMRFRSPADLRGVEYTMERQRGDLDTVRVFLPLVRRTRIVREDMRGESFLGTDFNYEDLGFEQLAYRQHTLAGSSEVDGRPCDRVESVPKRSWWYGRITRCIDREDHLPRLTEYTDTDGQLYKRRTMSAVETIASHPTPLRVVMETIPDKTSSVLILTNVRYGE